MKDNREINPRRRQVLGALALGSVATALGLPRDARADKPLVKVWKSPTCGCCKDWIDHLEENGFTVSSFDEGNSDARKRLGMPVRFGSCHTGEVEGYAIEGHVPAREIHRLLEEKPQAVGLSVPAMPRGSPGMDGPMYGNVADPYDVLLIDADGKASVYQSYR
ncbi:MAG: DUF411 domain-containing protein [Woeseiaceae bacterium]|nr:DUF411 domain-containing protein [Woeseiaceae bacterium]